MIKEIKRTTQFKKDYKKAIKNGCKEKDLYDQEDMKPSKEEILKIFQ